MNAFLAAVELVGIVLIALIGVLIVAFLKAEQLSREDLHEPNETESKEGKES